jgi:tetratricopeptide (TPR) repeat protein
MKKSILTGILALAAGASGLMAQGAAAGPKQPAPKSQAELTALQGMFQAQQSGNPDAIIKSAEDLITKFADTDFKEVVFLFEAQAYRAKNDDAKAQVFAERVLQVNPNSFQADILLGETIVKGTRENDLDREDKLTKADKYFSDAIAAVKASPKPNPQISDEQWADAQKQVQGEAHNGMGMAALTRKKYDVAINEFKAASDADPREPAYMARLASAYLSSGKFAEAGATADKILAMPEVHPQIKSLATQIKNQAAAGKK